MKQFSLILLTAGSLAIAGWSFYQRQELAQARDFDQRRFHLLEEENSRLQQQLAAVAGRRATGEDQARRAAVEAAVAKIRGLDFREPVVYDEVTRAGILGVMQGKLSEVYTDQEFANFSVGLAALGLLPPKFPLKERFLKLMSEQVAAFYDQHQHRLFMFDEATLDSAQNRVVLAHELTHALQDQHFGLLKLPLEIKDNDDRSAAATALVEGDATLVMSFYMLQNLSLGSVREQLGQALSQNMEQLAAAPRFLRETLLFPYVQGQAFCSALQSRGGFPALSRAYAEPPSSTAQILHPALYLATPRVEPIPLGWANPETLGQAPIVNNVAGEWGIRVLLSEWLDEPTALAAGEGWRGDHYVVYGDAAMAHVLWRSEWSSAAEASEFAAAMRRCLAKRHPATEARRLLVQVEHETGVRVVDAGDDAWLKALTEKL